VPLDALREDELVGEHLAGVEHAVAIGVFKQANRMRRILAKRLATQIHAGRIADVEPAPIVEGRQHRPCDQRRRRGQADFESLRHLDRRESGCRRGLPTVGRQCVIGPCECGKQNLCEQTRRERRADDRASVHVPVPAL
jgi:hypothetical protein